MAVVEGMPRIKPVCAKSFKCFILVDAVVVVGRSSDANGISGARATRRAERQ